MQLKVMIGIGFQSNTAPGDGSRYTEIKSYEKLSWLIAYIKGLAHHKTKIAFNMTWVG